MLTSFLETNLKLKGTDLVETPLTHKSVSISRVETELKKLRMEKELINELQYYLGDKNFEAKKHVAWFYELKMFGKGLNEIKTSEEFLDYYEKNYGITGEEIMPLRNPDPEYTFSRAIKGLSKSRKFRRFLYDFKMIPFENKEMVLDSLARVLEV